jgi:AAA15 family ATPase/GTPase
MRLDLFEYCQDEDSPNSWQIGECKLGDINLIVGKNASGKSRILNAVNILADLLIGKTVKGNPCKRYWKLIFDSQSSDKIIYVLEIDQDKVIREEFTVGANLRLKRNADSEGLIWAERLKQNMDFQIPPNQVAALNRRDLIQHPFLEILYEWAASLRYYRFGTELGRESFAIFPSKIEKLKESIDYKESDFVVEIFRIGQEEFKDKFDAAVKSDMQSIGYNITDIGTQKPSILVHEPMELAREPQLLYVQESDLLIKTEQFMMSQGMFRALSLIIQVNYSLLSKKPSCILIDDIGEGLDFERASALIKILIEKARKGDVQVIMTTNDRFIMNGVPLEYWSLIDRQSGMIKLHNIQNSREIFEQFAFTGLNNFDFFATEFYTSGFSEQEMVGAGS